MITSTFQGVSDVELGSSVTISAACRCAITVSIGMEIDFNDSFHESTRSLFLSIILEYRRVSCTNTLGGRAGEDAHSVMRILPSKLCFCLTLQTAMYSLPAEITRGPGLDYLTSATGLSSGSLLRGCVAGKGWATGSKTHTLSNQVLSGSATALWKWTVCLCQHWCSPGQGYNNKEQGIPD